MGPDADRANRLVATDAEGFLPNDIISQAIDSARLGGLSASRYQLKCSSGAILAFGYVLGTGGVRDRYIETGGDYLGAPRSYNCADPSNAILYRHLDTGVYRVKFPGIEDTDDIARTAPFIALITVVPLIQDKTPGLVANYQFVSEEDTNPDPVSQETVMEVTITDSSGDPRDANFSLALLGAL